MDALKGFLRQRGVTLTEAVLVTTVSLGIITGGFTFFQQASDRSQISALNQKLITSQAAIRREMASNIGFGAEPNVISDYLITASLTAFPTDITPGVGWLTSLPSTRTALRSRSMTFQAASASGWQQRPILVVHSTLSR